MKNKTIRIIHHCNTRLLAVGLLLVSTAVQAQHDPVQPFQGKIGKTLPETQQAWPEHYKKAPAGAPNVVWILLDDIGFGATSAFGGLIQTPTLDSLANNGLRYTNFHTTAICSPTRSALLTGRNSHSVHMGLFPTTAIGTPGYDGYIPFEKATIAEILRENGYNTYAVGKWHVTPAADVTPAGLFSRWPTGRGFDHYWGFLDGSTDQWHPVLWEDTKRINVEPNKKHFTTLLADKAINYISEQKTVAPDKPFFLYLTPGAGHSPHQVAKEWSDKYKGKFDQGWDKTRDIVLERQVKLGLFPKGTVLPEPSTGVKRWELLSAEEKKLYARFMENYAGFVSHADYEIGRVVSYLKEINQLDNTLIFVSIGDNGASRGGTQEGIIHPLDATLTSEERIKKNLANIDLIGTEHSNVNYPIGWAQSDNTPFRLWKSDANSEGGTHNPLIVFYPKGIKEKGGIRTQYSHVIDILPTTIELTGAKVPSVINGYPQEPIEGTSLAYSINNASLPSRHTIQHYEIMGSRSIYKDGWKAGVLHKKGEDFNKDVWELFNLNEDFNERFDVAAKYPEKLKELQELFDAQAWKYNIYPLKDENVASIVPTPIEKATHLVLYPGIDQAFGGLAPRFVNRSFTIAANVDNPKTVEGVLFSSGGWVSGISLYVQNNTLQFVYNNREIKTYITSKKILPTGKLQLKVDFKYDGGEPGSGATVTLYVNNEKVGEGRIEHTLKSVIAYYENIELGRDIVTPVTDKYKVPFVFTGTLHQVVIDLGEITIAQK
ncbi:MAG: Arylsulfatase [Chitinophagaceae bacterium]|nr:Arylsulfatase [Chitinophagaceae bacterium]